MTNKEIIEKFYTAFSQSDYKTIADCLSENIIYHDPMYGLLEGETVFHLWQLRCERLSSLSVTFGNLEELDNEYATCNWEVSFFHRPAGKIITMPGKAYMRILDNKITEHSEGYKLTDWLARSKGLTGTLFGWTGYMKRKEQNIYSKMLDDFIRQKNLFTDADPLSHDYDYSDR